MEYETMNKQAGTTLLSMVWGAIFVVAILMALAMPMTSVQVIVNAEWQGSTEVFGNWAIVTTGTIYDFLGLENLMMSLIKLSGVEQAQGDVELTLASWLLGRAEVINMLLMLLLLRLVMLLGWLAIFLPALLVVIFCALMQREENRNAFFFTSPYRAARWAMCVKLSLIGLLCVTLCPAAVSAFAVPLILCALIFVSGKLLEGLQKEI